MLSRPTRPTQRHVAVKILMPMRRIIKTHKGQCAVKGDSHAADDADSDDNVDDIGEDIDVDDEGDQNAGGAKGSTGEEPSPASCVCRIWGRSSQSGKK